MRPKLQRVCNLFISGVSMREALLQSGYSDSYASHNASKFLHNRECQRYIRARQEEMAKAALANAVFVENKLLELAANPDARIALKAIEQLDRHHEWMKELDVKYKALEQEPDKQEQKSIVINIQSAEKKPEDKQ
jgi:phage terminase small subunit